MTKFFAAAAFAVLALASTTASAQDGVSRQRALDLAAQNGMIAVEEVERDDGHWEIEGVTANGRELELDIHARTGAITDRDD